MTGVKIIPEEKSVVKVLQTYILHSDLELSFHSVDNITYVFKLFRQNERSQLFLPSFYAFALETKREKPKGVGRKRKKVDQRETGEEEKKEKQEESNHDYESLNTEEFVLECLDCKFNPAKFSALIIKFNCGTALIFNNFSVVLIGFKIEQDCRRVSNHLHSLVELFEFANS